MLAAMSKLFSLGRHLASRHPIRRLLPVLRARYDAAQTTPDNARHWAAADGLGANAANSPAVRATLRSRARYEVANNSYAKGIVLTLANDAIGTGPRCQLRSEMAGLAAVEREFAAWAHEVQLADKLRTLRMARATDGEAFVLLTANERLEGPVKLDLRLLEAEQVATPTLEALRNPAAVDGIEFDSAGNPAFYHVLKQHPGEAGAFLFGEFDRVPAANVLHYFRADRPGQWRGVPEITPALPLFAQLRRYTLAVIAAAETAADFAAVLYTDAPADGAADVEPLDQVQLEKRMATTLPAGWKLGQVDAAQPATTYRDFKAEILNEIARCLNMPFNVAACNSSSYNYASGRLDHQTYFRSIQVEQALLGRTILWPLFREWCREARLINGFIPALSERVTLPEWIWDGREHVDPAKEANAQATRLSSHTTTLATEYARVGKDWETELRQRAKELALMKDLGLAPAPAGNNNTNPENEKDG